MTKYKNHLGENSGFTSRIKKKCLCLSFFYQNILSKNQSYSDFDPKLFWFRKKKEEIFDHKNRFFLGDKTRF